MERFTKTVDGWWHDGMTGLEWSATADERMDHAAAAKWCESAGGRLPTRSELLTLVDDRRHDPCTGLPDTRSSNYWSASTYAPLPVFAWRVTFNGGFVDADTKTLNFYVRAVRGGS